MSRKRPADLLDRLRNPTEVSSYHRHLLMNLRQKLAYENYLKLQLRLIIIVCCLIYLRRGKEEVPVRDNIAILAVLVIIKQNEAKLNQSCGGPRFIPFPQRHRAVSILTAQDALDRFPNARFTQHFFFNPLLLMKVAFLFRITESEDICDPGYTFRLSNGCKMGAVSCFMIYLARFRSKAATLGVMSDIFGFTDEIHSRVIKEFGFFIYSRFSSNAFRFEDIPIILSPRFESFKEAFHRRYRSLYLQKEKQLPQTIPEEIAKTVLLIDGSAFQIPRPAEKRGNQQRYVYSSEHGHCIQALCLVSPDGLFRGIYGPVAGATNDKALVTESGIRTHLSSINPYRVLGDSIFENDGIVIRIPNTAETRTRFLREVVISAGCRGEVEHAFGMLKSQFPFFDQWKINNRSRVGVHLYNCVFFLNCFSITHGNQISKAFDLFPSESLEDYIGYWESVGNSDSDE